MFGVIIIVVVTCFAFSAAQLLTRAQRQRETCHEKRVVGSGSCGQKNTLQSGIARHSHFAMFRGRCWKCGMSGHLKRDCIGVTRQSSADACQYEPAHPKTASCPIGVTGTNTPDLVSGNGAPLHSNDQTALLKRSALESILKTALDGEALYTIFLGKPAITNFSWAPSQELKDQMEVAFGRDDGSNSFYLSNWVSELLVTTPLGPPSYFYTPFTGFRTCLYVVSPSVIITLVAR